MVNENVNARAIMISVAHHNEVAPTRQLVLLSHKRITLQMSGYKPPCSFLI